MSYSTVPTAGPIIAARTFTNANGSGVLAAICAAALLGGAVGYLLGKHLDNQGGENERRTTRCRRQGNATNHARAAAGGRQAGDQAARGEIWPFIWSGLIWLVWLLVLIGYLVARLIDRRRRRRQVRDSIARLIARQKQTNPAFAEAAEAAEAAEQRRARILSIRGRR